MVKARTATGAGTEIHRRRREPWRYDGSIEARNCIVEANIGLVWAVARRCIRFARPGLDVEDLVSAGVFGLMKAIDGFDPTRGVRFSTYATKAIRQHIRREMQIWTELPRLPVGEPETWPHRIAVDPEIIDATTAGREPDPAEAAEAADLFASMTEACNAQERFVLRCRFADGATLAGVGVGLGVTKERVRQIQVQALGRMRKCAAS